MPEEPKSEAPTEGEQAAQDSLEAPEADSSSAAELQPDDNKATPNPSGGNESGSSDGSSQPDGGASGIQPDKSPQKSGGIFNSANLYLIGFILLLIIAAGVIFFTYVKSKSQSETPQTASKNLSPEALQQLASSNTTVGGSDQLLTVQSNAIFTGQVLAQKNLEVAGNLKVGGNLGLPRIIVSGPGQFGSLQVDKDLSVAGNAAIRGKLSVKGSFSADSGHFNGPVTASQLSANRLQLSGELDITHHISAGGGTPGVSRGSAVGGGGSVSVSGSDTAGSIAINTGSGPPAGCLVTLSFTQAFHATPHVVVTPVGSAAGRLDYYINRSTTQFSICTDNSASSGANFGFDYIVFD